MLLAALLLQAVPRQLSTAPRFEALSPLRSVSPVILDAYETGLGLAQERCLHAGFQARILWIDATANIGRYNSETKIVGLVHKIKEVGFNTIVFDVKPISGQVVYPSKLAPKLEDWRGQHLPLDFDPLAYFVREAKRDGLTLFVSLNAFSEGHQLLHVGPGYDKPDQQTVLYDSAPVLRAPDGTSITITATAVGPDSAVIVTEGKAILPPVAPTTEVVISKTGVVLSRNALARSERGIPTVPKGAYLVRGSGRAKAFLDSEASEGRRLQLDSESEFVPISDRPKSQYPLMMDPNDPKVQAYEMNIASEIIRNYNVAGLIYDDRLRYSGLDADFSSVTREKFETALGKKIAWPDDVFRYTYTPTLARGIRPGRYYSQWIAWRAAVVRNFVARIRRAITSIRPGAQLGVYAGSWYGEYPPLGHNYASPETDAGFWFLSPDYRRSGTAPLLDFLIAGCYYPTATIYQAMTLDVGIGNTVESAATLVDRLVRDQCWTYAGISLSDFAGDPDSLLQVLQAACGASQGVMVFDLSHNIEPMWPVFAQAFALRSHAPHEHPELLEQVRKERASLDSMGVRAPRVIVAAGSAGVGQ